MKIPLKPYWELLARYLKPQRLWLALLAALVFGKIGLRLANPQIMRSFIDTATQTHLADQTAAAVLRRNGGNRTHAASELHIHRSTLIRKLKRYGIVEAAAAS